MDDYLFEHSLDDSKPENIALSKEVLYIQDINAGVYNGQIIFDTSSLSNSGRWLAWDEATLQIPFVVSFTSTAGNIAADAVSRRAAFINGLKNGYYQIIDSIQVDYNNTNVCQQTNNINQFVNFKLLTTMSASDVDKWGPTIGFRPDTPAYVLNAAASPNGNGLTNNRDTFLPVAATQFNEPYVSNTGFLNRKRETTAFSGNASGAGAVLSYGGIAFANASSTGKNFYTASPAAGGVGAVYYSVVLCTIRLSDLCDFFTKIPLIRGGFFRLTIVYNSCAHLITLGAGPPINMSVGAGGTTIRSGRTCPYIFSSATADNSASAMVATAQGLGANISIDSGVVRTTQINNPGGPFSSCRLYVPAYELDPVKEAQLLQIKPIRNVEYFDIYQYQFGSVAAGDTMNTLITNGIAGMLFLVVIPTYSYSDASIIAAGGIPSAALSPFDTYPGTGHPLAAITNFNVQVGGRNLFQQNFQYNFEFFMNEMSRINAINGGVEMGLTSGLITQSLWDNGYRFYVCDLTRRPSIEDGVAKSVQILGQNATPYAMNFTCFIAYNKKVNIDMAEGKLVA